MDLLMVAGDIADQDSGERFDLLHHAVDLTVFRTAYWDVGHHPCEEMAGRPQGL
jgi:hypothetical protein